MYEASHSWLSRISTRVMGYVLKEATLLTSLKSIQNHMLLSGFGTNNIGLCQALLEGSMTPSLNMSFTSLFTASQLLRGTGLRTILQTCPGGVSITCCTWVVHLGVVENSWGKSPRSRLICSCWALARPSSRAGVLPGAILGVQGRSLEDREVGC